MKCEVCGKEHEKIAGYMVMDPLECNYITTNPDSDREKHYYCSMKCLINAYN
jgi:hypothetical protein